MSDPNDPNATFQVHLSRDCYIATVCGLCRLRTRPGSENVRVVTVPGYKQATYCKNCYCHLHNLSHDELPGLPRFADLSDNPQSPSIVKFWGYLIKNGNAFEFWYPTDPIDLGCLRQTRQREIDADAAEEPS